MNYLTDNVSLFALIVERREPGFVAGVLCVDLASEFTLVFLNFFFPSFRFLTYSLKKKKNPVRLLEGMLCPLRTGRGQGK